MLRRSLAAILVLGSGGAALAADLDIPPPVTAVPGLTPRWEGFSIGGYLGGNFSSGQNVTQSLFAPFPFFDANPPTSFSLGSTTGGGGVQIGYDKQYGQFVSGFMADYGWFEGTQATETYGGRVTWPVAGLLKTPFTGTYSQTLDSLGTTRWRLGFAPSSEWLVYGDLGVAFGQVATSSNIQTNNGYSIAGARSQMAVGYTVGAGAQYAMGPNWSLGIDALYYNLGNVDTVSVGTTVAEIAPQITSRGDFSGYQLRLTALYQYDGAAEGKAFGSSDPNSNVPITVGVRAGYSTGRTQTSFAWPRTGARFLGLSYQNTNTFTAEPYFNVGMADTGIYLGGFAGIGQQRDGNLTGTAYLPPYLGGVSSLSSSLADGQLDYGVIDLGYNVMQTPEYTVGGFIGYTFENDAYNALGCVTNDQGQYTCGDSGSVKGLNPNTATVSDKYSWNAARIGISGSYSLGSGFTISGNAAYLPYVRVSETLSPWLLIPAVFNSNVSGSGSSSSGYQIEAKADYRITPGFDIGAGVRYWWMSANGNSNAPNTITTSSMAPTNWTSSRLQAFLETGYHF